MAQGRRWLKFAALIVLMLVVFAAGWLVAKTGMGAAMDPASLPEVERQFVERMRGVRLVGRFTLIGREDRPAPDRYDILSVDKVGQDQWRFNATIGETGVTLPIVVTMRFVGDTPMIMMTNTRIPGMGTFSARVFFHDDHYAGTWGDGPRGGHIFGRIERAGAAR